MISRLRNAITIRARLVFDRLRSLWHHVVFQYLVRTLPDRAGSWLVVAFLNEYSVPKTMASLMTMRRLGREGWACKLAFQTPWLSTGRDEPIARSLIWSSRHRCRLADTRSLPNYVFDAGRETFNIEGLEVFPQLKYTIGNMLRCYEPDLSSEATRREFEPLIQSALAAYEVCRRIEQASQTIEQIRLLLADNQTIPNAVIAAYFGTHRRCPNVATYVLSEAYSLYYEDRMVAVDVMLKRIDRIDMFGAYYADRAAFRSWYDKQPAQQLSRILTDSRAIFMNTFWNKRNDRDPAQVAAIDAKIEQARARGGRVFVLFAHLIYDRPYDDRGFAFQNMIDWIEQTIELFRGRGDLLLIKPHPSERRLGEAKTKAASIRDCLVHVDLPANVEILPPTAYNIPQIAEKMDCGIIWRSTAFLELTVLGVPAMVCAANGPYFDALGLRAPESREEYRTTLDALLAQPVPEELQLQAAAVIYFLHRQCTIPVPALGRYPRLFGENVVVSPGRFVRCLFNDSFCNELAKTISVVGSVALKPS
jgi:hypothetical protein